MLRVVALSLLFVLFSGLLALAGEAPATIAERTVRQLWDGKAEAVHATFDEAMKTAVSPSGLEEIVAKERKEHGKILALSDLIVVPHPDYSTVVFLLRLERGRPLRFTVTVRPDGRVAGLFFVPGAAEVREKELTAAISQVPGRLSVAALVAEQPAVAFRHQAAEPFSVGSQFKVLVLAGTAELVASGSWTLNKRLAVTARSRSLPSGILQDFDVGLQPTVSDLLTHMISISDNTATDTLLLAIGREWLDSRLPGWGFKSRPLMLTTAEMFGLASGVGGLPAKSAERRQALAKLDRQALYRQGLKALDVFEADREGALSSVGKFYETVSYSERKELSHLLDWRIPADELADFYLRVATGRFQSPEISGLVSKYLHRSNPGIIGMYIANDPRVATVGRKGGSDAGIFTDGGIITTKDGRHMVIVLSANDLPADASDKVMAPKLAELSQLLFDYLESRSKRQH